MTRPARPNRALQPTAAVFRLSATCSSRAATVGEPGRSPREGDSGASTATDLRAGRRGEQPLVPAAARLPERPRRAELPTPRRLRPAGVAVAQVGTGAPPRADRRPGRPAAGER